jgi:hypothetical protein
MVEVHVNVSLTQTCLYTLSYEHKILKKKGGEILSHINIYTTCEK